MELLTIETPVPADNAIQGSASQSPPPNGIYFKLAVPTEVGSNNSRIICFSLDANGMEIPAFTKVINLPVSTDPLVGHSLKGLEYSGNGNWLYTSNMLTPAEVTSNLSPIAVYDVSQPNNVSPTINVMNCNGCGNISSYRFSQIERSKSWDLYMTNGTKWLTLSQAIADNPTTGMNSWTASSNLNYTYDFNFGDLTPDMVANNFPNYGSKLYTLPDQNDNQNYATYFMLSNPTCCETYQGYYTNPLDGSKNVTINSTNVNYFATQPFIRFNGTVTISPGTVLSLNNKTWEFGPNGLIIVNPNAKFYASYSTLKATTLCANPQMWKGIRVSGNCNNSSLTAQGFVQFLSSTLSDAMNGIAVYNIIGALSSGGIVKCLKSTFINNQTSVLINGNCTANFINSVSWIRKCSFDWDNNYLGNFISASCHINLSNTNELTIAGCNFNNTRITSFQTNKALHKIGIRTYNAAYRLIPYTINGVVTKCEFKNLQYGINSVNAPNSIRRFRVDQAEFTSCIYGIFNQAVHKAVITRNRFLVGNSLYPALVQVGYVSLSANNYTITENYFQSNFSGNPQNNNTWGCEISNGGSGAEKVYKNQFLSLNTGNLSFLQNRSSSTQNAQGLQYLCNNHRGNRQDIYVDGLYTTGASVSNIGIAQFQGAATPAGNVFSFPPAGNIEEHWKNRTSINIVPNNIVYNYFISDATHHPVNYTSASQPTSNNLYGYLNPVSQFTPNVCSTIIPSNGNNPGLILTESAIKFNQNLGLYNQASTILTALELEGRDNAIRNSAASATPNEMWALRAELLGVSPFLDKEALREAANNTATLPHSVLAEIIRANPDVMLDPDFVDFLANKPVPLPSYIIDSLKLQIDLKNYKTNLINQKQEYINLMQEACNSAIDAILSDTTAIDYDNLRLWLGNKNSFTSDLLIANSYAEQGDYNSAMQYLTSMENIHQLDSIELTEMSQYKLLLGLNKSLVDSADSWYSADSLSIAQLNDIAQSGYSLSATIAIGTLNYFFDSTYTFPFNPLEGSNARTSGYSSNNKKISEFKNLYCSPNPANNYVVFHYNLLNERNGEIVIYTLDGKPLDKIVLNNEFGEIVYDTQSLTAGVYQYRLSLNGKLKEAQKLVIVKQ
jgi:hypothetical protein